MFWDIFFADVRGSRGGKVRGGAKLTPGPRTNARSVHVGVLSTFSFYTPVIKVPDACSDTVSSLQADRTNAITERRVAMTLNDLFVCYYHASV